MESPAVNNPSDPIWRGHGHKFGNVPSNVQEYIQGQLKMSEVHSTILLPNPRLSVLDFINCPLPPLSGNKSYRVPTNHSFFSHDDDPGDIHLLSTIPVPPPGIIKILLSLTKQHWLDGAQSIRLPGQETLFPLWAPFFWNEVQIITPTREAWRTAVAWVRRKEMVHLWTEVHATLVVLSSFAWSGYIPCASSALPKTTLLIYLSRNWFTCEHIDLTLHQLAAEIRKAHPGRDVRLIDTVLARSIIAYYEKELDGDEYNPNGTTFVHRFGQGLNKGSEFGGMFNINSSHWITGAIDLINEDLLYGDPMRGGIDPTVVSALRWFVAKHIPDIPEEKLEHKPLPCTLQIAEYDSWQCGLLGGNALAQLYLPDTNPLLSGNHLDCDLGRMDLFRKIVQRYHDEVSRTHNLVYSFVEQSLILAWCCCSSSPFKQF